jgi:hypothetical protein
VSGFGQRYVIDTNALSQLKRHRRASAFFSEHAVIPSEVLREASGFPDVSELRQNLYPTTPHVLGWLTKIMETVPADDTKLVDLYANKGGADPLVIACALDGQAADNVYIDTPEWVVVTDDDAVRRKAKEFGLMVLSSTEFAAIVDTEERNIA